MQECFLDFDFGLVVVVQFEDDVGEPFEVRIDRAVKGELDVACIKTALLRVVIANLDAIEIARAGVREREHSVEGDVHVVFAAANRDRLRERCARAAT